MEGNKLHVRSRLSPQNSGTITDNNGTPLHVAPDGSCWSNGQQVGTAVVSAAALLSDGNIYARGLKSGEWFHFVGGDVPWRTPSSDALNLLRSEA